MHQLHQFLFFVSTQIFDLWLNGGVIAGAAIQVPSRSTLENLEELIKEIGDGRVDSAGPIMSHQVPRNLQTLYVCLKTAAFGV